MLGNLFIPWLKLNCTGMPKEQNKIYDDKNIKATCSVRTHTKDLGVEFSLGGGPPNGSEITPTSQES